MLAPFISLHPCQYTEAASEGEGYFPHCGERGEEILRRGGRKISPSLLQSPSAREGQMGREEEGTSIPLFRYLHHRHPLPSPLLKCLSVEKKREARGGKDFDTDEAAGGGADFFLPLPSSSSPNVGRK